MKAMLPVAARARRETRPASEITLALQCGGSDGYSGITANPALGAAVDCLVKHGGTGVLAETGNLRCRASAYAPRGQSRRRRETDRPHSLVGRVHRSQPRRDEQ